MSPGKVSGIFFRDAYLPPPQTQNKGTLVASLCFGILPPPPPCPHPANPKLIATSNSTTCCEFFEEPHKTAHAHIGTRYHRAPAWEQCNKQCNMQMRKLAQCIWVCIFGARRLLHCALPQRCCRRLGGLTAGTPHRPRTPQTLAGRARPVCRRWPHRPLCKKPAGTLHRPQTPQTLAGRALPACRR